ncbi:MAG: MmgE/PrpD family protein, partial [Solirubrobacterales bacterium]|nr:MmgE/PrpD family protein [Solirubrobacterales bacterium]
MTGLATTPTDQATALANWATQLQPSEEDLALARRSLLDTLAVAYAARDHPLRALFDQLADAGRWAALAHVLDFDDLHMPSTTHISAICVPVALATGGDARAYLAGAGVMARLGTTLGWRHYNAGWHATCTAGAPAAAVTASIALRLDAERTATAITLAIPAAGGVQRAFGSSAKALQVGFAADAGVRAARLAQAGASADPRALDDWLSLVRGANDPGDPGPGDPGPGDPRPGDTGPGDTGPGDTDDGTGTDPSPDQQAIPDGLAIKLFPCCYALQRPISALIQLAPDTAPERIRRIAITTPKSSLTPLIHKNPTTGLEGKFSLEYAIAATLLDGYPDLTSFTDEAVQRLPARRIIELVETTATDTGDGLLSREVEIELTLADGRTSSTTLALPPGAPGRPPSDDELRRKL